MRGIQIRAIISISILLSIILGIAQSGDPQVRLEQPEANHDLLWLPASLISSKNYESAQSAIDSIFPGTRERIIKWQITGSDTIECSISDLLLLQKGYIDLQRGLFESAVKYFEKMNAQSSLLREIKLYLTAKAISGSKEYDQAASYAIRYIQDNPGGIFYSEMIALSAEADFSKRNFLQAAEKFKEAAECEYDPTVSSTFYLRAAESFGLSEKRGESYDCYYNLALKCNRQFLRDSICDLLPQDNRDFSRKIGYLLYERRLNRTAVQYLREVPSDDSLVFLEGLCRQRMGQYQTARLLFKSIKMNSPFASELVPTAKFHAAISAYLNKDYLDAISELKYFLRDYPQHHLSKEALAFKELIEFHKDNKSREVINYIYDLQPADRKFNIREVLLFDRAWDAYDAGKYDESCSLFVALQDTEGRQGEWRDGLFWALQAAKKARPELIEAIKRQLEKSSKDLYYPTIAGLSSDISLIKNADFFTDSSSIRETLISFSERWHHLLDEIHTNTAISPGNNTCSLIILAFDLGFEELGLSLLGKLRNYDNYALGEIVGIMDYLLKNGKYDEFYELTRSKIDGLNRIVDADFILYSPLYFSEVYASSMNTGIDPFLVWALIKNESLFDPKIESYAGALGLMQLMPKTAKSTARKMHLTLRDLSGLENPSMNIKIGTAYLADLIASYNGNLFRGLAAYNAGPGNVRKWTRKSAYHDDPYFLDRHAVSQTRHYVKAVLNDYLHYRRLWVSVQRNENATP